MDDINVRPIHDKLDLSIHLTWNKFMLRIALTGGIGSGKSTVAELFAKLGVPIIDADRIAKEITEPNTPVYTKILHHFGKEIIHANGQLNREKLRKIVFSDPQQRKFLEQIQHPVILETMNQQMERARSNNAPYCILVIPLLVEANLADQFDRILVVDVPEETQIKRAQQRDQSSPEIINNILRSQADREKRLAIADDIVINDGTMDALENKIKNLHAMYLDLSHKNKP